MRHRLRPTLALTLFWLTTFGGVAHAADYCVLPRNDCAPANTFSAVQPALNAAQGTADRDRVLIGSGDFPVPDGGFTYVGGGPIEILGAGRDATVLREPTPSGAFTQTVLDINPSIDSRSRIADLGFVLSTSSGGPTSNTAVSARATVDVENVKVRSSTSQPTTGVKLLAGATLSGSDVDVGLGGGLSTAVAASFSSAGAATVTRSVLGGSVGVEANGGATVNVSRTAVTTLATGLRAGGAVINAENVVVRIDRASGGDAFSAAGSSSRAGAIDVRHATVTSAGTGSRGLVVQGGNAAAETASGGIVSSIMRLPSGTSLSRHTTGPSPAPAANLAANHNDYDPTATIDLGTASEPGSGADFSSTTADPRFLGDPALGEVRLRFDSPLIDAGNPGAIGVDTVDFAGEARLVDGNGDGSGVRDMGAREYQRRPPTVNAAVSPASAFPGDPFAWTASGSDPDGDPLTYLWTWDDGTAAGANVSHAFGAAGPHTGTATVTDATGLQGSAPATVSVIARADVSGPAGPGPGSTPDRTAPSFSFLSRKLTLTTKNTVTVRLSCAAAEPEACTGNLVLASAKKLGRKRRVLKLGSAAFGINPGRPKNIKIKLSKRNAAVVRGLRKLKVKVTGVATDAAGNKATKSAGVTLTAARARR